ncbi:Hint domain-containing protein [Primorskyibacter sedentarius]|uniref:Hint domain-containing protein n=1 Tax=Primorskyibacter sedentarius TaxID=745311 RepID=UPI001A9DEFB3|nr:Hint domain-containing protein [Primorskyibacter sedentarius]
MSTYNQNGSVNLDIPLTDPGITVSFDPASDETIYLISGATYGFLLTDPNGGANNNEAVALTDVSGPTNVVINFYDIGGGTTEIVATNGAAAGATSTNLVGNFGFSIQFNQPDPDTPVFATTSPGTAQVVCFTTGTLIETPSGDFPVEELSVGDLVTTANRGAQPVRMIVARCLGFPEDDAELKPIEFKPGSLGNGLPRRALCVSPQHRILLCNNAAQEAFGLGECLVPAKALTHLPGIRKKIGCRSVTYYHLVFDQHEIVFSEGAPTESMFLGPMACQSLPSECQRELSMIFPDHDIRSLQPARPLIGAGKAQRSVSRDGFREL